MNNINEFNDKFQDIIENNDRNVNNENNINIDKNEIKGTKLKNN